MTTTYLPAPTTAEMTDTAVAWIATLYLRMSTEASRAYWTETFADLARRGPAEAVQTMIDAADAGDDLADAALRKALVDLKNHHQRPTIQLEAYGIKVWQRGIVQRGRGGSGWDHLLRDTAITRRSAPLSCISASSRIWPARSCSMLCGSSALAP